MAETQARSTVEATRELLQRYDRPGPRYTSYPTAPEWQDDFGHDEYRKALGQASREPDQPLSIYIHVPFCHERCAFCGCNVIISRKEGVADKYLGYVERELELAAQALGERRRLTQLHWGGGTPTFLGLEQIQRLFDAVKSRFEFEDDAEIALEVDPRVTTAEQIGLLRELGFNRISMGVQDLDPAVQCEIQRNQTEEQTRTLVERCRKAGFRAMNMDLIYGLPRQRLETWADTLAKVIDMRPTRLAVYSFAYLPDKLHNQRKFEEGVVPSGEAKYELLAMARKALIEAGYRAIGMDHFALLEDELSIALDERRLNRNFMGYTIVPASDLVGFGTSAIGEVGGCFAQNQKKLSRYYAALDENRFPTMSGIWLSDDDRIRAWVIHQLMCNMYLDTTELNRRFDIEYDSYFADADQQLGDMYEDGFLVREDGNLRVLPLGQIFVRNIAMTFDAYLRRPSGAKGFSRTI
jgi:oxygen-independent coproporphyrinogen III oxidase